MKEIVDNEYKECLFDRIKKLQGSLNRIIERVLKKEDIYGGDSN